jgi:acyl transferase domain-containing protein
VVVLRRLADALKDGDHIWAVIKGTAINNDGAAKAGYLAPSVDGQAKADRRSPGRGRREADTIDYVECHGTGTYLGDPIEVAALTQAFRESTPDTGFCRIGSVKTNIGHTDTAAGVASLIKVALALKHRQIPPSLGYERPNPSIDFEHSPFQVNHTLSPWDSHKGPRRAGGELAGRRRHQRPRGAGRGARREPSGPSDWPFQLLVVSGRSRAALDANAKALAAHLRAHPEQPWPTWLHAQAGARAFEHRRVLVAASHEEAARPAGRHRHPPRVHPQPSGRRPRGGVHVPGRRRAVRRHGARAVRHRAGVPGLDGPRAGSCCSASWTTTSARCGCPSRRSMPQAVEKLKRPSVQLPLIMIVEYALAQLWMSWGVKPAALVGHSMGENTAACLAGVMSFEDCIGLVLLRGQLFDTVPPGGMLSVPLPAAEVRGLLGDELDMASVNAPELCVVSGPQQALDGWRHAARARGRAAAHPDRHRRALAHARAHPRPFRGLPAQHPPERAQAAHHLQPRRPAAERSRGHRSAVLGAPPAQHGSLRRLPGHAEEGRPAGVSGGGARQGAGLAGAGQRRPLPRRSSTRCATPTTPCPTTCGSSAPWGACGPRASVDWEPIWGEARRHRVPLPTYAFQRKPYFIEPGKARSTRKPRRNCCAPTTSGLGLPAALAPAPGRRRDRRHPGPGGHARHRAGWCSWTTPAWPIGLVGGCAAVPPRDGGARGRRVCPAERVREYLLAPERGREGYDELVRDLVATGHTPQQIVHAWLVTSEERFRPGSSFFHRNIEQGFFSLLFLAQAMAEENLPKPLHLTVLSSGAVRVRDEALPYPEKAT